MTDQKKTEQKNNVRGYDVTIWETMGEKTYDYMAIGEVLKTIANKYVFQLEEGAETKRRHFQIRLNAIDKTRATALYKLFIKGLDIKDAKAYIHITPTQTGVHKKRDFNYVLKLDTRILGPWTEKEFNDEEKQYIPIPLRGLTRDKLRPFQQSLLDMTNIYDDRAIDFIYDPTGNYGKGFAADYLEIYNDCYILPSIDDYKLIIQDAHNFINSRLNRLGEKGRNVKAFILDMPRVMRMDEMHNLIGAIETIKGGRFVDYRHKSSAIIRIEKPRVFVFTNKGIDLSLYSKDRFKIWRITEKLELVPYTFPKDNGAVNLINYNKKEKKTIYLS